MKRALALGAGLLIALAPAVAPAQGVSSPAEPPRALAFDPGTDVSFTGFAIGVFAIASVVQLVDLTPDSCVWCDPPGGDRAARNALVWSPAKRSTADALSYATLGAAFVPALGVAIADGVRGSARTFGEDVAILAEPIFTTAALNQIVKLAVRRRRPYAYFGGPTGTSADENLSFFSEHTSFAFAAATSGGMLATLRGYRGAPAVWAVGLLAAVGTGYFRMAADKHYLSDVLTGAAVGSLFGTLMPWLLHRPDATASPVVPAASALRNGASFMLSGIW